MLQKGECLVLFCFQVADSVGQPAPWRAGLGGLCWQLWVVLSSVNEILVLVSASGKFQHQPRNLKWDSSFRVVVNVTCFAYLILKDWHALC